MWILVLKFLLLGVKTHQINLFFFFPPSHSNFWTSCLSCWLKLRKSLLAGALCWHHCRCLSSQWTTSSPRANQEAASWRSTPSSCNASIANTQQPIRGGSWLSLAHGPHRSSPGLTLIKFKFSASCSLLETFIWRFLSVSSGPGDEAKLFLWWHKALNLSVEQLQPQAGNTEGSGVIMGLVRLQTRLLQLGEERLNSGLLGAIGLGKRSPVSNKWASIYCINGLKLPRVCAG